MMYGVNTQYPNHLSNNINDHSVETGSSKRLPKLFPMGDGGEGFTLLFAFARGLHRVTKGQNRQYIHFRRNTQQRFDGSEAPKTDPI